MAQNLHHDSPVMMFAIYKAHDDISSRQKTLTRRETKYYARGFGYQMLFIVLSKCDIYALKTKHYLYLPINIAFKKFNIYELNSFRSPKPLEKWVVNFFITLISPT